ncbi:hypothetical protein [Roseivirga sp.]|uniref:hypothetical protein n=1 Tax=Roseivirga sp. TaxID=1964215 RepID=UPI003B518397
MLKFRLISALTLTALVSACGFKANNPEHAIVGRYEVQSITLSGCTDPAENDDGSDLQFGCEVEDRYRVCQSISLEFTNDREYIFSRNRTVIDMSIGTSLYEEDPLIGFYWIDGTNLSICFDGDCRPASFTHEGKILKLEIQQPNGCLETIMAVRK